MLNTRPLNRANHTTNPPKSSAIIANDSPRPLIPFLSPLGTLMRSLSLSPLLSRFANTSCAPIKVDTQHTPRAHAKQSTCQLVRDINCHRIKWARSPSICAFLSAAASRLLLLPPCLQATKRAHTHTRRHKTVTASRPRHKRYVMCCSSHTLFVCAHLCCVWLCAAQAKTGLCVVCACALCRVVFFACAHVTHKYIIYRHHTLNGASFGDHFVWCVRFANDYI